MNLTGLYALDFVLAGDFPTPGVCEVHGPPSSGRTTLAYYLIGEQQGRGRLCAYVDVTHEFFAPWARENGVITEDLLHSWPISGEECFETACELSRQVDFLVLDGFAMITPHAELQDPLSDLQWFHAVGAQKRLIVHGLEQVRNSMHDRCTVLLLNQIRTLRNRDWKTQSDAFAETTLAQVADVRLRVERDHYIDHGYQRIGTAYRLQGLNNRDGLLDRQKVFEVMRDEGVSREGDLMDEALRQGVLTQCGSWIHFGDVVLGQGREKARQHIRHTPSCYQAIEECLEGNSHGRRGICTSRQSGHL